jgi:hypothetical protein
MRDRSAEFPVAETRKIRNPGNRSGEIRETQGFARVAFSTLDTHISLAGQRLGDPRRTVYAERWMAA